MAALVLALAVLASACTYTYRHTTKQSHAALYTAWGLDLAGVAGSVVAMERAAFTIDGQPARIATMAALFGAFAVYGLSAKSGMAETEDATIDDCIAEWERINASVIRTRRDVSFARPLPCDMGASQ